jgi:hypothetical protein
MKISSFILFLLLCVTLSLSGQDKKPNNWSVGAGVGWFHYINTLDLGAELAKANHAGYTFRFMWEPEHRLAIGLESGYYTIYSMEQGPTPILPGGSAKLSAIPLLLSFRIRVLPHLYLSGGPGMTIMYSDVTVLNNTVNSSFLSLANLHVSAMYRKKLSDRVDLGGEIKFLNFGKTEDYGYSLQVIGAYHFRFKR